MGGFNHGIEILENAEEWGAVMGGCERGMYGREGRCNRPAQYETSYKFYRGGKEKALLKKNAVCLKHTMEFAVKYGLEFEPIPLLKNVNCQTAVNGRQFIDMAAAKKKSTDSRITIRFKPEDIRRLQAEAEADSRKITDYLRLLVLSHPKRPKK